jgi:hypothetical protein
VSPKNGQNGVDTSCVSCSDVNANMNTPRPSRAVRAATAGWAIAVVACTAALVIYGASPGHAGQAPATRPAWLAAKSPSGAATLVVAVHPRCPCTAATVDNLEHALHVRGHPLNVVVLSFAPDDAGPEWRSSSTLDRFKARLDAQIVTDTGGRLAKSLGAYTSGHVIYYDQGGALRFSGGVTPSRGHEGGCVPLDTVAKLAGEGSDAPHAAPSFAQVFGCPISTDPCGERADAGGCAP